MTPKHRNLTPEYETLPEFVYAPDVKGRPYDRWSFDLTYARAKKDDRSFHCWGMTGPVIPNAYENPDSVPTSSSRWDSDVADHDDDVFYHALSCAVNEAVHEALEWLRLDGETLLDPHGVHEAGIFNAVADLVDRVAPLALEAYKARTSS